MSIYPPERKEEHFMKIPIETVYEKVSVNDSVMYLLIKRLIDVFGAVVGLILLSPLLLIIAILIKIEEPKSSVFFSQKRVGKNGEIFYIYKFRSMVSNAEELKASLFGQNEASGPVFKIKSDPRITKIGKFIRKTSIDELPQLINILKNDMSLVGPRPPLPEEVELYTRYERQRLSVTPGLTCYWQVTGRNNIGFEEWVKLDLDYIRNRNTVTDIKLIFRTLFVLFGSKNAY